MSINVYDVFKIFIFFFFLVTQQSVKLLSRRGAVFFFLSGHLLHKNRERGRSAVTPRVRSGTILHAIE